MKVKELKNKTDKELRELLNASRFELGQLKFNLSSKKLKNVKQITALRKMVARAMTILRSRQLTNK